MSVDPGHVDMVPVDMILYCPSCGRRHVDRPETDAQYTARLHESSWWECGGEKPERWTNPPHRSHLCEGCGYIWRPADCATNGVDTIATRGKADSAPLPPYMLVRWPAELEVHEFAERLVNAMKVGDIDEHSENEEWRDLYVKAVHLRERTRPNPDARIQLGHARSSVAGAFERNPGNPTCGICGRPLSDPPCSMNSDGASHYGHPHNPGSQTP